LLARRGAKIDLVLRLEVDTAALVARVTKRFEEQGRPDDNPDSFKVRLKAYTDQTAPLIPYYDRQDKLVGVDGMADVETVAANVARALD
jgi:adenylate kinase